MTEPLRNEHTGPGVSCQVCRDRLNARHDAELPPQEAAGVDRHLATCADCRRELESLQALSGLLRSAKLPAFRIECLDRVPQRIVARQRTSILRFVGVWTAAAACLLAACAVQLARSADAPPSGRGLPPAVEQAALYASVDTTSGLSADADLTQWIVQGISREKSDE